MTKTQFSRMLHMVGLDVLQADLEVSIVFIYHTFDLVSDKTVLVHKSIYLTRSVKP